MRKDREDLENNHLEEGLENASFIERFKHTLDSEFANVDDPLLAHDLSFSWMRDHGLLRDFIAEFHGDMEEALTAVREVRRSENLEQTENILASEPFWQDFYEDIMTGDQAAPSWEHFMKYYYAPAERQPSSTGKYRKLHDTLLNDSYDNLVAEAQKDVKTFHQNVFVTSEEHVRCQFFEKAPILVQGALLERFPDSFETCAVGYEERVSGFLGELEYNGVLPGSLTYIMENASSLTEERQERVFGALAGYIHTKDENYFSNPDVLAPFMKQAAIRMSKPVGIESKSIKPQEFISNLNGMSYLVRQAEEGSVEAERLLNVLETDMIVPQLMSGVYKPVSLFWNLYFENGGTVHTLPENLDRFVVGYMNRTLTKVSPETPEARDYVKERIAPQLRDNFQDIARAARQLEFLRQGGEKPLYTFMHQVEGIAELLENEGGILADEPGMGKTLMLALTALNKIERDGGIRDAFGRVLVVANKTAIDNWEEELKGFIDTRRAKIINVNTPPDPSNPNIRLEESTRLNVRLEALREALESQKDGKQMILVNYDLFRDARFQKLLSEYDIGVLVVDEAHHMKSRSDKVLDSLVNTEDDVIDVASLAQRTKGLYEFIKKNPEIALYMSTATPYVKDMVEPLILAYLTNPNTFQIEQLAELKNNPKMVHRILREVMVRRRKKEVSNLPDKETIFSAIHLDKLPPEEQEAFKRAAEKAMELTEDNGFARFYALLSLESQVKRNWLRDTVERLQHEGKKVLIFTPFVRSDDRYSGSMSTISIAEYLQGEGIDNVGILDGSLDLQKRREIQQQFRLPLSDEESLDVIVGNYQTAGESITLCSKGNKATEVILFVAPNSISRLVQAVDRVHRFGQTHKVTIHVPFVTHDVLGRDATYDERVVGRLYAEQATYEQVIDGLVFVERPDLYQDIIKADAAPRFSGVPIYREGKRGAKWISETKTRAQMEELLLQAYGNADDNEKDMDLLEQDFDPEEIVIPQTEDEGGNVGSFLDSLRHIPILDKAQEQKYVIQIENGKRAFDILQSPKEAELLSEEEMQGLVGVVASGKEAREAMIWHNQRLVVSIAAKYQGQGVPIYDLFQEGTLGLMRAVQLYDRTKINPQNGEPYKFSTYSTWWIRQVVSRAVLDTGRTIRLPVHLGEKLAKKRNAETTLMGELHRKPTEEEVAAHMNTTVEKVREWNVFMGLQPASLDTGFSDDDQERGMYDAIPDAGSANLEEQTIQDLDQKALTREVGEVLKGLLDDREYDIVVRRHLESNLTLEDLGRDHGISRERIRQIEGKALNKIRGSSKAQDVWKRFAHGAPPEKYLMYVGKDPDALIGGGYRRFGSVEPLVEEMFALDTQEAKILYRNLFLSLDFKQIAHELNLEEHDTKSRFEEARLNLWQRLKLDSHELNGYLHDRLRYFPAINPANFATLYPLVASTLDSKTCEIVESYFGFNGGEGSYHLKMTSIDVGLSVEQTRERLLKAVRVMESIDS